MGVAGWNITLIHGFRRPFGTSGFGTLLGPERTPTCWWLFFLAPGLDRLTDPDAHVCLCVGGCGGGRIGLGCGCVLSVA